MIGCCLCTVDGSGRIEGSSAAGSSRTQEGAGKLWESIFGWSSSISQKYWWNWYFAQFSAQDCNLQEIEKVGLYMTQLLWLGCPREDEHTCQPVHVSDLDCSQENEEKISSTGTVKKDSANTSPSKLHSYIHCQHLHCSRWSSTAWIEKLCRDWEEGVSGAYCFGFHLATDNYAVCVLHIDCILAAQSYLLTVVACPILLNIQLISLLLHIWGS